MKANAKIHQAYLDQWTSLITEQAASGLTIRAWCEQNNISIHKYNYWKHLLKENLTDKVIPDIVPITASSPIPQHSTYDLCESRKSRELRESHELHELYELHDSYNNPKSSTLYIPIAITIGDVRIEISSSDISLLSDIIKAVRYA